MVAKYVDNFNIVSLGYSLHFSLKFSVQYCHYTSQTGVPPVLHIIPNHLQTMWNLHDLRLRLLCVSKILIQLRQKLVLKATNAPFRGIRHNYGDIFRFHDCTFIPIICFRQFSLICLAFDWADKKSLGYIGAVNSQYFLVCMHGLYSMIPTLIYH